MLCRVIVKCAKEGGDIPLKYDIITCERKNHLKHSCQVQKNSILFHIYLVSLIPHFR